MKNRDNFIDLMEEIDVRHLDEHIKKNTDFKAKRIKRYIAAVGIYAAACVAVLLLIPFIINHTVDVPPHTSPGAEPITTEPAGNSDESIDELFKGTKLYKVLNTAGVKREDVESLQVDFYQIENGDVYYLFDGIYKNTDYKNTEVAPIYTRNDPYSKYPIESFMVTGDYIICEACEDAQRKVETDLYCYNMKTGEEILVCSDDIYRYDVYDGKVVYLTADSINSIKEVKVYTYDPEENKSTFICDLPDSHRYLGLISYNGSELALATNAITAGAGQVSVLDLNTGDVSDLFPSDHKAKLTITVADEGYYVAYERAELDDTGNLVGVEGDSDTGVWYIKNRKDPVKVSDTYYNELYYVNEALVGVNGEEITLIVEKPTEEEKYGLEEDKIFPRPEVILISCKYDHRQLTSGDALYEYFYEKINARVKDGKLQELTDRNHDSPNKYRGDKEVYVEFKYSGDSSGAPFYPDKEDAETVFTPSSLFFPLTGDNTDTVLLIDSVRTDENLSQLILKCYGTLAEDPEIEAEIWDFFSYAAPEKDSIDEYFADTGLYRVLGVMGLERKEVTRLCVGGRQIVNGDVYYANDGIYKNTDDTPVFSETNPIDFFYVSGDYIFYAIKSEADIYPSYHYLYCYNVKTEEKTVISTKVYCYDVCDGEVVYLILSDSNNVKVYTFNPNEDKSRFVCEISSNGTLIQDISCIGGEMAFITDYTSDIGQVSVLDLKTGKISHIFSSECKGVLSILAADEGYYVSFRQVVTDENGNVLESNSEYDGLWYAKVSEKPVKILDFCYDELYYTNGKLVGMRGDIFETIDTVIT